jgi:hypothetical protein
LAATNVNECADIREIPSREERLGTHDDGPTHRSVKVCFLLGMGGEVVPKAEIVGMTKRRFSGAYRIGQLVPRPHRIRGGERQGVRAHRPRHVVA